VVVQVNGENKLDREKYRKEVLDLLGEERKMISLIIMRKKNWIGHILRHAGLLRDVLEGKMQGKRPPGRPRIAMLNELKEDSYG